jgi:hypothetical protein
MKWLRTRRTREHLWMWTRTLGVNPITLRLQMGTLSQPATATPYHQQSRKTTIHSCLPPQAGYLGSAECLRRLPLRLLGGLTMRPRLRDPSTSLRTAVKGMYQWKWTCQGHHMKYQYQNQPSRAYQHRYQNQYANHQIQAKRPQTQVHNRPLQNQLHLEDLGLASGPCGHLQ